jgi:hypothetical protein
MERGAPANEDAPGEGEGSFPSFMAAAPSGSDQSFWYPTLPASGFQTQSSRPQLLNIPTLSNPQLFSPNALITPPAESANVNSKSNHSGSAVLPNLASNLQSPRKRKLSLPVEAEDDEDEDDESKKTSHNKIEKRYRYNINSKILELKQCVPSLRAIDNPTGDEDLEGLAPAHKTNKATVLLKTIEYIKHLEKQNETLKNETGYLKSRITTYEKMIAGGMMSFHNQAPEVSYTSSSPISRSTASRPPMSPNFPIHQESSLGTAYPMHSGPSTSQSQTIPSYSYQAGGSQSGQFETGGVQAEGIVSIPNDLMSLGRTQVNQSQYGVNTSFAAYPQASQAPPMQSTASGGGLKTTKLGKAIIGGVTTLLVVDTFYSETKDSEALQKRLFEPRFHRPYSVLGLFFILRILLICVAMSYLLFPLIWHWVHSKTCDNNDDIATVSDIDPSLVRKKAWPLGNWLEKDQSADSDIERTAP